MKRDEQEDAILDVLKEYFTDCGNTYGYKVAEKIIVALNAEPCEDCVSREAVIALAKEECETAIIPYKRFVKGVNALPPVTPKQRTGKWIRHTRVKNVYDIAGVKIWGIEHQCDQCAFTTIATEDFGYYDYCPNCGAKMEGESE